MYKRHVWFYFFLRYLVIAFSYLRFGYRFKSMSPLSGPTLVLSNHVTDYDPLLVGCSFPAHMYFVASEHIARWKFAFKFLDYIFAPIIRYKGSVALSTVREVLRRVKAGKNVCIFAEGARSWDGLTNPILSSTGKLVKMAACNLVTYRIEGGYFVSPNWSEGTLRRGRICGAPVGVYTAEEIAAMSVDEINALIARDLHEDAYARQLVSPTPYRGKRLAEKLENLMFICPRCGKIDTLVSKDCTVSCTACGHAFNYTAHGFLEGTDFKTVQEFADWQKNNVEKFAQEEKALVSPLASLSSITKHEETPICSGELTLTHTHLRCGEWTLPLSEISEMSMHGRHALVFSSQQAYFELIPKGSNALKFLLLFQAYKGILHNLTERVN